MLEYFVHLDKDDPPDDLVWATADIPENVSRERVRINRLPVNWRDFVAPSQLARFVDQFVNRAERRSILIVPSALASRENNWLINPAHGDSRRIVPRARVAQLRSADVREAVSATETPPVRTSP